ncbi:hypothetical protein MVQ21_03035 [Fusobacterium necrophorum]|uniref:hypothetical protein n=1 Tax=Fusobacterium necrophorum TaxID=859 RepID=UPI00254F84E4|nr:hypothetical protein [Fusobacterium necrophorum]MDK4495282.1 hypothetical protein [Fusobacterium necrophorum]MDK4509335.1 hypothetical protein [Fusobacterium necrophorum]
MRTRIRPTIFNISLVITILLMLFARWDRGYLAFGGETLLPLVGLVAYYALKDWWDK